MTDSGQRDRLAAQRQLGAALRALQHRSGHTLRELEKQVHVSDSSLSRYFRGDAVAPWPVVVEICRALGGDPSEIRALWEAADRVPDPAALVPAPASAPEGSLRSTAPVPVWRRSSHPTGRARPRVRVVATVITSVLLAAALTVYGVRRAAESPSRNTTMASTEKGAPHLTEDDRRPVFYEAEKARRNQVTVREAAGARSDRAIAHMDYPDSYVEFTIVATSAGPRAMSVRFSNGSQDGAGGPSCASHSLSVNGAVANAVHYPHTGWENWQKTDPVTVVLHEGRNAIRFAKGDLFTELDGIELT
jgi:hypothetical protein